MCGSIIIVLVCNIYEHIHTSTCWGVKSNPGRTLARWTRPATARDALCIHLGPMSRSCKCVLQNEQPDAALPTLACAGPLSLRSLYCGWILLKRANSFTKHIGVFSLGFAMFSWGGPGEKTHGWITWFTGPVIGFTIIASFQSIQILDTCHSGSREEGGVFKDAYDR